MDKQNPNTVPVSDLEIDRGISKLLMGGYDDRQRVRKGEMNRIRDLVRKIDKGIPLDQPEEKLEEKKYENKYKDKNLPVIIEQIFKDGKVSEAQRDNLLSALELAIRARSLETSYKPKMKKLITPQLIWQEFLVHIPGIGETLATDIFSKVHAEKFKSISALWKYCGMHLVCPVCTQKVLKEDKERVYALTANSFGVCPKCGRRGVGPKKMEGKSIDFNPKLRELAWKIGDCLIKQSSPKYYDIYLSEKNKQLARIFVAGELNSTYDPLYHDGKNPYKDDSTSLGLLHAHRRGMRKMIKIFLQHLWVVSRKLANLPVSEPYVQAHMKHVDIITFRDILQANGVEPSERLAG